MVKPTVISTFAGGGGSSLGYYWAGFKELLAIDFDKNSCDTLKANFKFPVWQRDIKEVIANEILKFCKIKKGELDILDGSPPCQGFSTAGKRNLNDSRNDLFKDFVRLIKELQPKVFIMENVSGMIKGGYKGKFNEILQTLKETGYKVKVKLMNAMWYEVPQSRERVFFIGIKKDLNIEPSFPKPLKTFITVKEILNNCPDGLKYKINPKSKLLFFVNKMKQGQSLQQVGCKFGYDAIRLNNNKPSPTIKKSLGSYAIGMIHPTENRRINISELKRLSSYPDDFCFIGNYSEQWAKIGNSVMPKQMYHIAKHIKETILENNGKAN